jgi:hypothetical protein
MSKFAEILMIIGLIAFPIFVSAFYESPASDLSAVVDPSYAAADQSVSISLVSYLLGLDACKITWTKDGQTVSEGIGQKGFRFNMPPLGKRSTVAANVSCPTGRETLKQFIFQSNDVDLLAVADTYVPPFYKGSSRPSEGSGFKVSAFPLTFDAVGRPENADNLIYKWKLNGRLLSANSGYGKKTLNAKLSGPAALVTVEVSSLSGELKAVGSISLNAALPEVLIYKDKALLGPEYRKALVASADFSETEASLIAEPFFFDNKAVSSGTLSINWQMNGKAIPSAINNRILVLRQNSTNSGEATIGTKIKDQNGSAEAEREIKVKFGTNRSLFGL